MNNVLRRALARHSMAWALLAFSASGATSADELKPAALELDEAADLAVAAQPLLEAYREAIRAADHSAVAGSQLPDPVLVAAISDMPVEGADRFSLRAESDTQLTIGVKQAFPAWGKRGLRLARGRAEVERNKAELEEQIRMARREAGMAWLEVWKATQSQTVVRASIAEARRQEQAVDIGYRAGRASQADLYGARIALELLEDSLAGLEQQEVHARNQLRRWIGADADRVIGTDLPPRPVPDADALVRHIERHPHVAVQDRAVTMAQADADLARAEFRPDCAVQVAYGHRRDFVDYASLQFEVGLPVFTGNRQERVLEARTADVARARNLKMDWIRQHTAAIQLNVADWQRLQERLARYENTILTQAAQRLDAALATYAAGSGTLVSLLDARRAALDVRMQRLDLQMDAARHQVELQYYAETTPGVKP
jgi:outer membrane protein, heavy metal efflux system